MKIYLIFIAALTATVSIGQDLRATDRLVDKINRTVPTDSISLLSISNQPNLTKVTGYFKGNVLQKSVATFRNTHTIITTYYKPLDSSFGHPVFVTETDSASRQSLIRIYCTDWQIEHSFIDNSKYDTVKGYASRVFQNSNFSGELGFARVDRAASKYTFTGKLTKSEQLPPGCGILAFALVQKFEVVSTNYPNYQEKNVLLIQPCPDFLPRGFFKQGASYEISVATNSGVTFDYSMFDSYKTDNSPRFWIREIKKIR